VEWTNAFGTGAFPLFQLPQYCNKTKPNDILNKIKSGKMIQTGGFQKAQFIEVKQL
jgi:hypothetical protein